MQDTILSNLDNPLQLERLYRADKAGFKRSFNALYPQLKDTNPGSFWHARLNYPSAEASRGSSKDLLFILIALVFAAVTAKLPAILSIGEEAFYTRNAGFILFPALSFYFAWKNRLSLNKIALIAGVTLVGLLFINFLPPTVTNDTLLLSCIHLPILLWAVTGFAFVGEQPNSSQQRLHYLSYNGDLIVISTLILIAGGILTGVTIGLFELIGLRIEKFYFEYIVICGLPAAPILGTYLIRTNPQLVGRVSPVIARLFSPLVLVMLVIYLIAIVYSGKDPYNDREFLLLFNVLLIGVMAIIFFSVAEASRKAIHRLENWVLLLLSIVTIVVNGIALSAILFRISTGGFTPNRTAVLGSNVLILLNLLLVTVQLFKVVYGKRDISSVGKAIAWFLPVYCLWAIIVTFLFPFVFS